MWLRTGQEAKLRLAKLTADWRAQGRGQAAPRAPPPRKEGAGGWTGPAEPLGASWSGANQPSLEERPRVPISAGVWTRERRVTPFQMLALVATEIVELTGVSSRVLLASSRRPRAPWRGDQPASSTAVALAPTV